MADIKILLEYLNKGREGYDVRFIVTMRNYAADAVIKSIEEHTVPWVLRVKGFSDDEIKEFLKVNMQINNPRYVNHIIRIAEGNPRIAYMAGQLAKKEQSLDAIGDAVQLYENYYGKYLSDSKIMMDRNLGLTAGIVALLKAVYLDNLCCLEKIFQKGVIDDKNFIDSVFKLFDLEIIDIDCREKRVAAISDQCLSNYLLFMCFFQKRYLEFSDVLEIGFRNFRKGMVKATGVLWNVFSSEQLHDYLTSEIIKVWDIFEKEADERLFADYVKEFHFFRPEPALLFVENWIGKIKSKKIDLDEADFNKSTYLRRDSIIDLLSGYRHFKLLPEVIEILCDYVIKKQDAVRDAFECIKNNYSIDQYSYDYDYYTERTVLNVLAEKRENDIMTKLYIYTAAHFLLAFFRTTEVGRGRKLISYKIPVYLTKGSMSYRESIWKELICILQEDEKWQIMVWEELLNYARIRREEEKDVILFDKKYIPYVIEYMNQVSRLKICVLCQKLERKWKIYGVHTKCFEHIYNIPVWNTYCVFTKSFRGEGISFEESECRRKEWLSDYADANGNEIRNIVRMMNGAANEIEDKKYLISDSLQIFISIILEDKEKAPLVAEVLLENIQLELYPGPVVKRLIELWGIEKTYDYISEKGQNEWQFLFFEMLELESYDDKVKWRMKFLEFLKEDTDKNIVHAPYRNLAFLQKFLDVDPHIYINVSKIILQKKNYNDFMQLIYFGLLFYERAFSPENVYSYFETEKFLLIEIYFSIINEKNVYIDFHGNYIRYFIEKDTAWIKAYSENFCKKNTQISEYEPDRIISCWKLENYNEVFDCMFEDAADNIQSGHWWIKDAFRCVLINVNNEEEFVEKRNHWFLHAVRKNINNDRIFVLFDILSELDTECRKAALKQFIMLNQDFEIFKKLQLEADIIGGSGSMLHEMRARIEYYETLLPLFTGRKLLKHKQLIKERIDKWKKRKKNQEMEEIILSLYD